MKEILHFIESEKERFLSELVDFLKIPSVSSKQEHKSDMENCSQWLIAHIKSIGFKDVRLYTTIGHPIVYAQWLEAGEDAPTVLVYGHYDVQPVDPIELWNSPPFEPVIKNGKIWARGTSDDKGQLFCHLKALESHFKINGKLPVNVKLLFEGEEECGSSNLDDFIINNKELLACDTVIISDSEWFADDMPSICYGMRGISYFEVTVKGPDRDLHSGTYGGAIDNPLNVLCWMMTQLKDSYGRITIDGFYDDVIELLPDEREVFLKLPYNEKSYCDDLGINAVNGEFG